MADVLAYVETNPFRGWWGVVAVLALILRFLKPILPIIIANSGKKAAMNKNMGRGTIRGMSEKGHANITKFDSLQGMSADKMEELDFLTYEVLAGQMLNIFFLESQRFMREQDRLMMEQLERDQIQFMDQQMMFEQQMMMDQQQMLHQQMMDQQMMQQQMMMDQMNQLNMQNDAFSMNMGCGGDLFGNGMGF